ncbi:SCO4402 family protein [Actinomadura coerulea]|uniref:SCO4402 family protein n=1 Tax=Actinomadura coerulea TaxID=46159 RepID=UPI003446B02F
MEISVMAARVNLVVVQFPDMRRAVIEALQALSDPEYQRRVWVERTYPRPGFYDDLTHNVNVLYDDTSVAEDPRAQIGVTLENEAEAAAIESLTAVLDPLLDSLPTKLEDAQVISRPEWSAVVSAAQAAVGIIQ